MRICRICFTQDPSQFYPRGLRCKRCKIISQVWAAINKRGLTIRAKPTKLSKEEAIKRTRAASLRYYYSHLETSRVRTNLWKESHREHCKTYKKDWLQRNKEIAKLTRKRWRKNNPQKMRLIKRRICQQRRAQQYTTMIERFTTHDIAARDNWRCHICKKKVSESTMSIDHLIPLSRSGSHTRENVALAHRRCNSRRSVGRTIPAQLRLLG